VADATRQGEETESSSFFGDYREVNGVMFPFLVETLQEGAPGPVSVVLDKIEVNPEVAASRFEMPKPEAPKPPQQ
jgi:hypothetical protein